MFDHVAVAPSRHPRELLALSLAHACVGALGLSLLLLGGGEVQRHVLPDEPIEVPIELRVPPPASAAAGAAGPTPRAPARRSTPAPARPAPAPAPAAPTREDPAPDAPASAASMTPPGAPEGGPDALPPGAGRGSGDGDGNGNGDGNGDGDGDGNGDGVHTIDAGAVRVRSQRSPVYPASAAAMGIEEAVCTVQIVIDPRGVPSAVNPTLCPPIFVGPTVEAAMKWRFYPVRIDGEAVPARFVLRVNYRLR